MKALSRLTSAFSSGAQAWRTRTIEASTTAGCFLLEKGVAVLSPHCSACGRTFEAPRLRGQKFDLALEFLHLRPAPRAPLAVTRLFIGSSVMLAGSGPQLADLLDTSAIFVGDAVLVANPAINGASHASVMFCEECGTQLVTRLRDAGRRHYAWDRLIEFAPRGVMTRIKWRALPVRTISRSFSDINGSAPGELQRSNCDTTEQLLSPESIGQSFFLARDVLLSVPCSIRAVHTRALREQRPISVVVHALNELGAVYTRNGGDVTITASPESIVATASGIEQPSFNMNPTRAHRAEPRDERVAAEAPILAHARAS